MAIYGWCLDDGGGGLCERKSVIPASGALNPCLQQHHKACKILTGCHGAAKWPTGLESCLKLVFCSSVQLLLKRFLDKGEKTQEKGRGKEKNKNCDH